MAAAMRGEGRRSRASSAAARGCLLSHLRAAQEVGGGARYSTSNGFAPCFFAISLAHVAAAKRTSAL